MASQEVEGGVVEQLVNSEACKIPYPSLVSYDEQDRIRLRIETFLMKNGILDNQRMEEIYSQHLTPDEWAMIKDTPERYWPDLFASRMNPEEREKVDKGGFIQETYSAEDSKKRYFVSSMVWTGVAEYLYFQSHGSLPSPDEEQAIIKQYTGPYHRCFFVLAEPVANLRVIYDWADNFCRDWENFKQAHQRNNSRHREMAMA